MVFRLCRAFVFCFSMKILSSLHLLPVSCSTFWVLSPSPTVTTLDNSATTRNPVIVFGVAPGDNGEEKTFIITKLKTKTKRRWAPRSKSLSGLLGRATRDEKHVTLNRNVQGDRGEVQTERRCKVKDMGGTDGKDIVVHDGRSTSSLGLQQHN